MSCVLVADDDPVQLDLRRLVLEAAGYEVCLAPSPAAALSLLRERAVELVILDLRFPDAHGLPSVREGLALIRAVHEMCAEVPMLVLSGWPEDIEEAPECKWVWRVLTKPVKPSLLMQVVRETLPW